MDFLFNFIVANIAPIVLVMLGILLVVVVLCVVFVLRLYKSLQKYKSLLKDTEGKNLEEILLEKGKLLEHTQLEIKILGERLKTAEEISEKSIRKVGLVRFDAFQDTGGELSYALALLNNAAEGVVLSSIFSQEDARTYCKAVTRGESKHPLSEEEKQAIKQALNHKY
jgi:hypothetical protein